MSTITPSMVLVLVSRKVNGLPVGVEPTFRTGWAEAGPDIDSAKVTSKRSCKGCEFHGEFPFP